MGSKTTYSCDWCGKKCPEEDESGLPATRSWVLCLDTDYKLSSRYRDPSPSFLFPESMRMEKSPERDLCDECVQALQDAVRNVREIRISKRPKK